MAKSCMRIPDRVLIRNGENDANIAERIPITILKFFVQQAGSTMPVAIRRLLNADYDRVAQSFLLCLGWLLYGC
jgi:hypothetical protein